MGGCSGPEVAFDEGNDENMQLLSAKALELAQALNESSTVPNTVAGSELRIQLAFESTVDLDLYVTDPLLETVYFANQKSVSGGRIIEDVRCEENTERGVRIEEIRFTHPYAGRYRVGVDFPERCNGGGDPAAYAVSVSGNSKQHAAHGIAHLKQFEVVVLEFDLANDSTSGEVLNDNR